jgi:small-conductance mechanosensitive channel
MSSGPARGVHEMHSPRAQFAAIKNSTEALTPGNIVNLKREKQNLIRERTLLTAKLARYASFNRHAKPPGRNQQIAHCLAGEVEKLEQLTAMKREDIARLIYSDRAAVITELQEESKMLHLEVSRLTKLKQDTEVELRELSARLDEATQRCCPAAIARQQTQIKGLEKAVAAQRAKNEAMLQRISARQQEEPPGEPDKRQQKIDQLRAQVKREQQEIASLDEQMARMKEEHAKEMQRIQSAS